MEDDLNFKCTATHNSLKRKRKHKSQTNQKYDENEGLSFAKISEALPSEINEGHKVKRKKNKRTKKNSKEFETKERGKKRKQSSDLLEEDSEPAARLYKEKGLGDHFITCDTAHSFIIKKQKTITAEQDEVEEWNTENVMEEHHKKKKKKRKHSSDLQEEDSEPAARLYKEEGLVNHFITCDTAHFFIEKKQKTITAEQDEVEEWNTEHVIEEHRKKKKKKKKMKNRIRSSEDKVKEEIVEPSCPNVEILNSENEGESLSCSLAKKLKKKRKLQLSLMSKSSGKIASVETAQEETQPVTSLNLLDCHEAALKKMEEFIPHVRSLCHTTVLSLLKNDLPRFQVFKKLGIPIKHGRFTMEENQQIQKNVEIFLELTGIDCADKLFNPNRYPEESAAIKQAKLQNQFLLQIAEGIPRTCKLVLMRAEKIFNIYNYKGRYTKEEERKLREYHATCGNNWKAIGELMCRSNHSIALKYSQLKTAACRGPWTKEETTRLLMAIEEVILNSDDPLLISEIEAESSQEFLSVLREKLYKGISWVEVEAKVGTRNWMQCKSKWTDLLTTKMTQGQKVYSGYKGLQAKINMIKRLYEMQLEDSNEVNWEELADCIGDVPPSYVQAKFYKLKACRVPNWNKKTFPEIIDFLYENTLPEFEERLSKTEKKFAKALCNQQKQTVFRICDIFQYEYCDSENE
uniref:Transcription termination factor 1 isoform X2 n=1 Tax=Geotrypetes seraphini TaxID=260995 RepID=A0A6P8SIX0_GEOSA|nr:transcription termination factor 1 isoform X2 [Geotrypetes seraphini]